MARPSVLLSVAPDHLTGAARVAEGIEVKLDWGHAATLSSGPVETNFYNDWRDTLYHNMPCQMNDTTRGVR
jgi:hypothetical protein